MAFIFNYCYYRWFLFFNQLWFETFKNISIVILINILHDVDVVQNANGNKIASISVLGGGAYETIQKILEISNLDFDEEPFDKCSIHGVTYIDVDNWISKSPGVKIADVRTLKVRKMEIYISDVKGSDEASDEELAITGARKDIIQSILNKVSSKLEELNMGIEIVDVQIKRVSYNKQVQTKLFNRMVSEQNMIAEKYRAQGQGKKQEILGMQEKKEKEILSEAYVESQTIMGKADAEAVKIYADSYSKSPEFYNFNKTLESYKESIDSSTQIILSTDNKYLKYLNSK